MKSNSKIRFNKPENNNTKQEISSRLQGIHGQGLHQQAVAHSFVVE
jgi:hypothetical protein